MLHYFIVLKALSLNKKNIRKQVNRGISILVLEKDITIKVEVIAWFIRFFFCIALQISKVCKAIF